jgi:hypothetical protein
MPRFLPQNPSAIRQLADGISTGGGENSLTLIWILLKNRVFFPLEGNEKGVKLEGDGFGQKSLPH